MCLWTSTSLRGRRRSARQAQLLDDRNAQRWCARALRGHEGFVNHDYEDWLRWWREIGRADLEDMLLQRWSPLGASDDTEQRGICARYATRIGVRLRYGISGAEIADLLGEAN